MYYKKTGGYSPARPATYGEGSAEAHRGSTEDVFFLQRRTLTRKLSLLYDQLNEGQSNLENSLSQIQYELCTVGTMQAGKAETDIEGKNHITLKYKLPLYREARQRRTDWQRDAAQIKRELLETKLKYLSLQDKDELLQ